MKRKSDFYIALLIGVIISVGLVWVRYYAWSVAHPDAPLWTFFLGG